MNPVQTYHCLRVIKAEWENKRTRIIELDVELEATPGQFVMVWLPGIGEKPYSIMQSKPLTLMVVDVGAFSHALSHVDRRQKVWIRGPFGNGFSPRLPTALLAAGGYGAAPLFFLAQSLLKQKTQMAVLLGARTKADLVLVDQFKELGIEVNVSTEDGSMGETGLVTELAGRLLLPNGQTELFACGPKGMLDELERIATKKQVPFQFCHEAKMRCGIGLCGSCELEMNGKKTGWLVCRDGPVFLSRY